MSTKVDSSVKIQTDFGLAEMVSFSGLPDGKEHVVLAFGDWKGALAPNIRIHSECLVGDLLRSKQCGCGSKLHETFARLSNSSGLIVYLRQQGIADCADARPSSEVAAEMLKALGVGTVTLLSENPQQVHELQECGVEVISNFPFGKERRL